MAHRSGRAWCLPRIGAGVDGAELDSGHLDHGLVVGDDDLREGGLEPLAQGVRRGLLTAAAGDERLDLLLDAELLQAGAALVQVLLDLRGADPVALLVEIDVDVLEDFRTRSLMGLAAAHLDTSRAV